MTRDYRTADQTTRIGLVAMTLFAVTAVGFVRLQRRRRRRRNHPDDDSMTIHADSLVGIRGHRALQPSLPYLEQFLSCMPNMCDPVTNPTGYIPLCVAENRLIVDMLAERFMQVGTATAIFSDSQVYFYSSFLGMPVTREAAAYFLAQRFLFPDEVDLGPDLALAHIQPRHVAIGAGGAAILNNLFFLLGDAGDGCLIPRPYYAAFENDIQFSAGIVPVGIAQANAVAGPTNAELDAAYRTAVAQGHPPKFILLTNPNNPLGTIYAPDVMLRIVTWARQRRMHTIVDEIYALGVHVKRGHGFHSIIQILNNDLGNDVHFLWAVSKDFGASGLRVGIVYSQNEVFMQGLATANIFTCVSQPIQYLVSELWTDDQFLDHFLDESRHRTLVSYHICVSKLQEMVVPFVPSSAGIFVYVDFSSLLPQKTFAGEQALCKLIFDYAKIVLTPGESQRDPRPGMFRICYAWVAPAVLAISMERLSRLVAKIRKLDWSDLNERSLQGVIQGT